MLFEFDKQDEYWYIILCLVVSYMVENKLGCCLFNRKHLFRNSSFLHLLVTCNKWMVHVLSTL